MMRKESKGKKPVDPVWLDNQLLEGLPYILCTNKEMYREVLTSNKLESDGKWLPPAVCANTELIGVVGEKPKVVVCIDPLEDLMAVFPILIHEAVHIFQFYLSYIVEDKPGSEIEAYIIQHISQRLMAEYLRQTGRVLQ